MALVHLLAPNTFSLSLFRYVSLSSDMSRQPKQINHSIADFMDKQCQPHKKSQHSSRSQPMSILVLLVTLLIPIGIACCHGHHASRFPQLLALNAHTALGFTCSPPPLSGPGLRYRMREPRSSRVIEVRHSYTCRPKVKAATVEGSNDPLHQPPATSSDQPKIGAVIATRTIRTCRVCLQPYVVEENHPKACR